METNPSDLSVININEIVTNGVANTEIALFSHCEFIRKRLTNLTNIIEILEDKLLKEDGLAGTTNREKLRFYETYSRISLELLSYLKNIHTMVTDDVKFNKIQRMLAESQNSINPMNVLEMSPKLRSVISMVKEIIEDKNKQ